MSSRKVAVLLALALGAVLLLAACFNPGPTVVAQPEPLPPLTAIVPITGDGSTAAPEGVPASFVTTCGICHTVADAGTTGTIGPELSNIGAIAGTRTSLSAEEYIRQSIDDPGAFIAPGYTPLMTAGLHDVLGDDYEAVVAYLLTLTDEAAEAASQ
ncbi:MAG: cytochrome c [Chloroflexota bacterium]|nr:cytochrome c [Chloroflexota bacterium]MDE2969742.1 cytochrome c [Chloroflexota bacterium]